MDALALSAGSIARKVDYAQGRTLLEQVAEWAGLNILRMDAKWPH